MVPGPERTLRAATAATAVALAATTVARVCFVSGGPWQPVRERGGGPERRGARLARRDEPSISGLATVGCFPVDGETLRYLRMTGRGDRGERAATQPAGMQSPHSRQPQFATGCPGAYGGMTRVWQWFVHAPGETVQFWREPRDPFILGVFLGVLAILAVYHLLLSLSLHDRGCLAYALVLGSFIGVLAIAEGLVYRHLLGERLALVNNLLALGCALLLLIWMTQFSRIIFATKRELPTADRLLVGLIVFDTANLLLWVTILTAVRSTYLVQFLLPLISVPHGALLLTVGIIAAVRRAPFAGLYLAGWVLVFAGSWLQLLREDQVLADNLATRYAIYWGVLGQICCLSLAVSIRLDRLRHHREQQMRKLMEADKLVSIGTMAASLSHEIANPTSAIAANAAFLRTYVSARALVVEIG